MTNQRHSLDGLFEACWKDEALKDNFMSDPKTVLSEHRIDIQDNISNIDVIENAEHTVHFTLPTGGARSVVLHRPSGIGLVIS